MIGGEQLAAMTRSAVLINVGRGPVVDEVALIRVLTPSTIKGAALDVFEREPLPNGHPFYRLDNVLLSPHTADRTEEWLDGAMKAFLSEFERCRQGKPLLKVVDKTSGY